MGFYVTNSSGELIKYAGNSPQQIDVDINQITNDINSLQISKQNKLIAQSIQPNTTRQNQNDTVVEYWVSSDNKSWYRIWASGWKECGGQVASIGKSSITLPLPSGFITPTYTAIITPLFDERFNSFWWAFLKPYNTTTLNVWAGHHDISSSGGSIDNNCVLNYYCCGY